jgi:dienelactone hydrolase
VFIWTNMTRRAKRLVVAGAVFTASLLGVRALREPAHATSYERLVNARGMPLRVVTFTPEPAPPGKAPAVIVAQPVNTPTEYGRALTMELLPEGYRVLTFDWRGWLPTENRQFAQSGTPENLLLDVAAAVGYLRRQPGVDPERIAVTGHSAGGTLAIQVATADPSIMAVAAIGMEADVTPTRPRNLLWAVGLYDEFRTLTRMRDFFWASANAPADVNTTVGDFQRGTARRLAVSPTADHFTELQDRMLHREIVNWFNEAAGKPATTRLFWMQARQWLLLLNWLSALLVVIWGLLGLLRGSRRAWAARLVPALALAATWGMTRLPSWNPSLRMDIVQLLVIVVLVVGFARRLPARNTGSPPSPSAGRKALRVGALVWLSFFLTLLVNNIASYLLYPVYLLWTPVFAAQHLADLAYVYTLVYPHAIFFAPAPTGVLEPRLWVYLLLVFEAAAPGILLGTVAWLARRRPRAVAPGPRRIPVVPLVVLIGLLGALGVVVVLRLQQGFLTAESAMAAGRFLLRFAVLPIVLFVGLQRATRRRIAA